MIAAHVWRGTATKDNVKKYRTVHVLDRTPVSKKEMKKNEQTEQPLAKSDLEFTIGCINVPSWHG